MNVDFYPSTWNRKFLCTGGLFYGIIIVKQFCAKAAQQETKREMRINNDQQISGKNQKDKGANRSRPGSYVKLYPRSHTGGGIFRIWRDA